MRPNASLTNTLHIWSFTSVEHLRECKAWRGTASYQRAMSISAAYRIRTEASVLERRMRAGGHSCLRRATVEVRNPTMTRDHRPVMKAIDLRCERTEGFQRRQSRTASYHWPTGLIYSATTITLRPILRGRKQARGPVDLDRSKSNSCHFICMIPVFIAINEATPLPINPQATEKSHQ